MAQSGSGPNPMNGPIHRPPVGNIVWGIVLNAVFPVILYQLSKRYVSPSEFTALMVAALFPIGKSAFELLYHRQLDPVSILVLLGIGADSVALLFGGGPRLLLVRESLITGVFGLACFFLLLLPRPMMFYFGRYFIAGTDPARQARFNNLPAALVLVISPILIGVLTISTMAWAFAYGHRVRLRALARFAQIEHAAKHV